MTINEVLMNYSTMEFNGNANIAEINYSANEKELNSKYERTAKILNVFSKISNRIKVNGIENLHKIKDLPCVIIANYKSCLYPVYLSSALKGYKKIRWIGSMKVFEKNEALGIFPERAKNKSDELPEFYGRAARVCIENNVPYVPVAIAKNTAKLFWKKVDINVGRPVYLRKIDADFIDYKLISFDMKGQIDELLQGNFDFFPALYEK